jgi:hypothetical protein
MSLRSLAQEKIERSGIANYAFDESDGLLMCGVHYTLEACDCGESDCDGVRLIRASGDMAGSAIQ